MANNKLPSMGSFSRSFDPSPLYFYERSPDGSDKPISVISEVFRGAKGTYIEGDIDKLGEDSNLNPDNVNIKARDSAKLSPESDTLVLKGTVKVLSNSQAPYACNDDNFKKLQDNFIQAYKAKGGFEFLSCRYTMNMINGSFLWRNRYAEKVVTKIKIDNVIYEFDLDDIAPEKNPLSIDSFNNEKAKEHAKIIKKAIALALKGDYGKRCLLIEIEIAATLGMGQTVYPSQEIPGSKRPRGDWDVSRILAKFDLGKDKQGRRIYQAHIHGRKVGNALRTIDDWYAEGSPYPIPVEPYGVDQSILKALRRKGNHLYSYLVKMNAMREEMENSDVIPDHCHFVAACFIRGGVFSKTK